MFRRFGRCKLIYMKRVFMLMALSLVLFSAALSAQNISNTEKRKMNMVFLESIERLESVSDLSSVSEANEFISMFRDQDMMIYNDLIGVHEGNRIKLLEYVSVLRQMQNVEVVFRNVSRSDLFVYKGSLSVRVDFDKIISYRDDRNVLYSSEDFYKAPHKVSVIMSYDDFDGTCLIESMEGSVEGEPVPGNNHVVFSYKNSFAGLRYRLAEIPEKDGYYKPDECGFVLYNREGQAILPESAAYEDWYYMQDIPGGWDPDIFISSRLSKNGILHLDPLKKRFRIKAYTSIAPAGAFAVEGDFDGKYSFGNETGVEGRFMMNVGRRLNLGVYGAMGIAYDCLDLSIRDFSYSYQLAGQTRKYDFEYIGQSFHFVDAVLSGGLALEQSLSQRLSLDFTAGVKAYYNIEASDGDMRCEYLVQQGAEKPIYKKGHFKKDNVSNRIEIYPDVWPCPFSAEVSLGVNYNLSKSLLLTCGLEYEYGFNWYHQSENLPYKEYEYPVSYSHKSSSDVVNWTMGNSFSLKKRALWLNLGVVYKF